MQFKKQGGRIQVLKYAGYDKAKRRAVVKMVGSFDAYTLAVPVELEQALSPEDLEEVRAHIKELRTASDKRARQAISELAADRIKSVARTISEGDFEPSERWAADVWAAVGELAKAMRKAGYPKPRKAREKAVSAAAPGQAGLPL